MLNLFGTDGIRGEVDTRPLKDLEAITALHNERKITTGLMSLVGESLAHCLNLLSSTSETVVVGWDERPNNALLACHLTLGLRTMGVKVIHIGICATPLLHYATLKFEAGAGCMITASHNPVTDSGIKIFDSTGYKTNPEVEAELTRTAYGLANEERTVDLSHQAELMLPDEDFSGNDVEKSWATETHRAWLSERCNTFELSYGSMLTTLQRDKLIATPLLLDSSKGSAHYWLSGLLEERGISNHEISSFAEKMNHECGAGELSPSDFWSWEDIENSEHSLVRLLDRAPDGMILAAALDGDGDRCLFLKSTGDGVKVVDGDEMADTILRSFATKTNHIKIAASIESDLALLSTLDRLNCTYEAHETAVGDRWLAYRLGISSSNRLIQSEQPPFILGVEDSGHIVLPSPHPLQSGDYSLVGDGAASMLLTLAAMAQSTDIQPLKRGYKKRISVKDVDRSKWDGLNSLSDEVEILMKTQIEEFAVVENWKRDRVDGEENLMRLTATLDSNGISIGIRNSGTQAKISISVRMQKPLHTGEIEQLIHQVAELLRERMS